MLGTFTLKNGLKVASYQIPQMRSVFISLAVKAGSIFDRPETSGTAHLMEHILVQATPSFPDCEALAGFIESMAGNYNAATAIQSISFHASLPAAHLPDILKIAAEVFYQPLFNISDIERERGAVLEEIRQRQDQVWFKNHQFWSYVRYKKGHPMLMPAGGLLETVANLKKEDLVGFWKRFFHPDNSFLVVVGGHTKNQLVDSLESFFENNTTKKEFEGFPKVSNRDLSNWAVAIREDHNLQSCYLDITAPSVTDAAPIEDRITQSIIADILGGLRSSRLFRLLRQQRGLVYDVGFSGSSYNSFGLIEAHSQVAPEKLGEVLRLVAAEIASFKKAGPTKTEVDFAKNYFVNRVLMQFDHPTAIANWIQSGLMWEDRVRLPEETAAIAKKVDRKKIMDFMQKYWQFDKLNLVVQGPVTDSKENRENFEGIIKPLRPV